MIDDNKLPTEMKRTWKDKEGVRRTSLELPRIVYCGMMAQMLERVQSTAIWDILARNKQMAIETQNPEWLMSFDVTAIARTEAQNAGVPQKYLRDSAEVLDMMQQVQQAQGEQRQAAVNAENAEAMRAQAQAQDLLS